MQAIKSIAYFGIFLFLPSLACARDWYEYKSDNFAIYSDVSGRKVENLVREMENFRQGALVFTGLKDLPENKKLRILYFNSNDEFDDYTGKSSIAGFYKNTWDGPLIFSSLGGYAQAGAGIMFHEYIHYLMRERSGTSYPAWYSEGFAELLASADVYGKNVTIGNMPEWRKGALQKSGLAGTILSINDLLSPDPDRDNPRYWNSFYATSWLFTHYLQLGSLSGNTAYNAKTRKYLAAYSAGENPVEVFEKYYGKSPDDMDGELKRYTRDRLYGYKIEIAPYKKEIERRKLGLNERYYIMADEAEHLGRHELAEEYLNQTDEKQPGWQQNLAFLAVLKNHKEDSEYGQELISKIEGSASLDPLTSANISHFYTDRLESAIKNNQQGSAFYMKAVAYGDEAVKKNPQYILGYRYLWEAHKHQENMLGAVKVMMAAYQKDPKNLLINEELGFYLASKEKLPLAKPFLERVVAWSHPGKTRAEAEKLLESSEPDTVVQQEQVEPGD